MARPKKGEEQSKDPGTLLISREDFVRTRDSVVTGLATLQSAVQDLSRAYITHTNTVLGKGTGSSLELPYFTNPLGGEMSLFGGPAQAPAAAAPEQSAKPEVKKRKRAPHDKNAPKRPRTPYFLYMQFARDAIAREMGNDYSNKQVQDEGTRRWNSMGKDEKEQWAELYGCNYAAYKRKVQAYKAGHQIPDFTAAQARQLYDEDRNIGAAQAPAHDATSDHDENVDSEEASDTTSSSAEESPEPPKAVSPPKSPRASKRGKGAKGKVEKRASPVKEPAPVEPSPKSPEIERKKKGTRKHDAKATVGSTEPKHEDQAADSGSSPTKAKKDSEPEPKSKRKKRKSEALGA